MVQIIENWSLLKGTIVSVVPAPGLEAFQMLELDVSSVDGVEDFPNLLSDSAGHRLRVFLPHQLAEELRVSPGQQVCCRVRRAGLDRIFAHPDQFAVE